MIVLALGVVGFVASYFCCCVASSTFSDGLMVAGTLGYLLSGMTVLVSTFALASKYFDASATAKHKSSKKSQEEVEESSQSVSGADEPDVPQAAQTAHEEPSDDVDASEAPSPAPAAPKAKRAPRKLKLAHITNIKVGGGVYALSQSSTKKFHATLLATDGSEMSDPIALNATDRDTAEQELFAFSEV